MPAGRNKTKLETCEVYQLKYSGTVTCILGDVAGIDVKSSQYVILLAVTKKGKGTRSRNTPHLYAHLPRPAFP